MQGKAWLWLGALVVLLSGCSAMERLTLIRPSAKVRGYTQVAPSYDVSGKKGTHGQDPKMLLISASDLYQSGDLQQAETLAHSALKMQPGSADANTLLGLIAQARGDQRQAGGFLKKAVDTSPQTGAYATNYGNWLCTNGRAAESLEWFNRALLDVNYASPIVPLVNAGNCASQTGQSAQAEAYWRKALDLQPKQLAALAGMAQLMVGQKNYFEARAFAERWLAETPTDVTGLQLAAEIEQKLGDNVSASRYLSRIRTLSSGSATVQPTPQ